MAEVRVKVYDLSIDLEGPLQDVKVQMDHLQKCYGDKFERLHLEFEQEPYGDSYRYYLYGYREQTTAELRVEREQQARFEAHQRGLYEKLKEKFG